MSSPLSPTRLFLCDRCQTALPYDPTNAGKKIRCQNCGRILITPGPEVESKAKSVEAPQYIELWCKVCDTRIVAHGHAAGKKVKCPDCGASNAVPIPKDSSAPREPPAMRGQQYAVWDVNKAPDSEELRAGQPKLFPVYCQVCDTLMYARHKHIGGQLKCPDCGALTKVKAPPEEPEKKSVLVPAGQEYKIDPALKITSTAVPGYVERLKHQSKKAVEEEARRHEQERPQIPLFPTLFGVWSMLLRDPVPTWWVGTSAVGMVVAMFALEAANANAGGGGGLGAMYLLLCMVNAIVLAVLLLPAVAAICLAIVAESSEGHRKLHSPPSPWIFESFFEMFYLIFPITLSLIPTFVAMKFVAWEHLLAVGCGSLLLFFPLILLSASQQNNPMSAFSARIWGSLILRPAHWLLFYIQSAIIWAIGAWICAGIIINAPVWILATVPIALGTAFLYFRVLGRFAWWLSESLSAKTLPKIEPRYKRF
jgi:DNA-directed RNA polymerase subunit M/transcription elongation factor TFIIS